MKYFDNDARVLDTEGDLYKTELELFNVMKDFYKRNKDLSMHEKAMIANEFHTTVLDVYLGEKLCPNE